MLRQSRVTLSFSSSSFTSSASSSFLSPHPTPHPTPQLLILSLRSIPSSSFLLLHSIPLCPHHPLQSRPIQWRAQSQFPLPLLRKSLPANFLSLMSRQIRSPSSTAPLQRTSSPALPSEIISTSNQTLSNKASQHRVQHQDPPFLLSETMLQQTTILNIQRPLILQMNQISAKNLLPPLQHPHPITLESSQLKVSPMATIHRPRTKPPNPSYPRSLQ